MDKEFFKQIIGIFQMESEEHVQTMKKGLADLSSASSEDQQQEILETIHRAAHSLKGAARTVGLSDVEPICQSIESAFSQFKREKVVVPPDVLDLFERAVNELGGMLSTLNTEGKIEGDKGGLMHMIEEINDKLASISSE